MSGFANGSLPDEELLLRRFNRHNPDHCATIDQGTQSIRLTSGCLSWDREPEDVSMKALVFGISVYRDAVLHQLGLAREAILEPPRFVGIGGLTARDARAAGDVGSPNPVDVIADPQPSQGTGRDHNAAHALITVPGETSRNQRRKLASRIAGRLSILVGA